jgi:murein DD-endopeptidase MepM/ murein hydrolase activator NlpD
VWNNLRARHYSVLILLTIVALETSAIAIDRFINRESDTAFAIESPFQNNSFIQTFKVAEASCKKVPAALKMAEKSTPAISQKLAAIPAPEIKKIEKVENEVAAPFVAASGKSEKVFIEYAIQPGDSLSHIATLFGAETDVIRKVNELESKHVIKAGETIKVPLPNSEMTYRVKSGDSLSKIASKFRVPLSNLIAHNSLKSHVLKADQQLRIPVKKIDRELKLISNRETIKKVEQRLSKIDDEKPALVASKPRFEAVKMNRIQMAQAPAVKPDIKFIEKELLKAPPTISAKSSLTKTTQVAAANVKVEPVKASVKTAQVSEPAKAEPTKLSASSTAVEEKKITAESKDEKVESLVYTVKKGDNLLKIAHRYNTTVAQIKTENKLNSNLLKVGEQLKISPDKKLYRVVQAPSQKSDKEITIVSHKVRKGESLSVIARKYRTTIKAIITENDLESTLVKAGQTLKVPADKKQYSIAKASSRSSKFMKMPARGRLSDRYGWRNHPVYRKRLFHAGIDIAAPKGSPIKAAMSGKVIYAGRRSGYGKLVIISHSNGYSTRYAHCSSILVKKGQQVKQGQLVARVGATGVATGNHLHFEVRKNGKTLNPLTYLN